MWAFGAVLYEMLTGRRAFPGEDLQRTLGAVLNADPDWSVLPADLPRRIRRLLELCLERDIGRRAVTWPLVGLIMDGARDRCPVQDGSRRPEQALQVACAVAVGRWIDDRCSRFSPRGARVLSSSRVSRVSCCLWIRSHGSIRRCRHLPDGRYIAYTWDRRVADAVASQDGGPGRSTSRRLRRRIVSVLFAGFDAARVLRRR